MASLSGAFLFLILTTAVTISSCRDFFAGRTGNSLGLRVDLIHPASDSSSGAASRHEKIKYLVSKSHVRRNWLVSKSKKKGKNPKTPSPSSPENPNITQKPQDYESPLSPDGGGYIMEITVGTPGQTFKAIADTGSDLVWIQSDPCEECSGTVFHPKKSSSYRTIECSSSLCKYLPQTECGSRRSCSYLYEYGSGETAGIFANETVSLGTTSGGTQAFPTFAVGCGSDNEGFDGVDGLVGLGQGPVSLTTQLGSAINHKFSYCLVDINNPNASSPLFFGNSATLNGSGVQSTAFVYSSQYPTFYMLKVTDLRVAGTSLGSTGDTIIDSGTTLTYIPDDQYSSLVSKLISLIKLPRVDGSYVGLDLCYDMSSNKEYEFPSLTFELDGATLTPPSGNYFIPIDEGSDVVCLAMGSADGLPVSIVGNIMQQGYHILYDRGSSKLSFVREDCGKLK